MHQLQLMGPALLRAPIKVSGIRFVILMLCSSCGSTTYYAAAQSRMLDVGRCLRSPYSIKHASVASPCDGCQFF
ncbi:hypothetical protein Ancab_000655 [Ancistrocladus abbreviatus]